MFKNALRLPFRLLKIPLYLDVTFLIVLPLLAWLIGSQLEDFITILGLPIDPAPLLEGWMPFLLGLWAALALFISVVIHELGHAVTARLYGVETERITLWLLGGMAHLKEIPEQRGAEAVVAIAGPLTSIALGIGLWLLLGLIPTSLAGLYFVVVYTMAMNFTLAIFNLIPALPLDGGRVLRSLLHLRMSKLRATQVAARVSRFIAVALGLFGLLSFNLFLILIAFFIYMAVTAETQSALFSESLSHFTVTSLMSHPVQTVPPELTVQQIMDKMFAEARLAYPILGPTGEIIGQIELKNLATARPERLITDFISPPPITLAADKTASDLFDLMLRDDHHRVLITDPQGQVIGIITKTDLIRALQIAAGGYPAAPSPR